MPVDDLEMKLFFLKEKVRKRTLLPLRRATAHRRVLPDFLLVGAQKSGTSSFYEYLTRHPRVLPAFQKEVHRFDAVPYDEDASEDAYRPWFPTRARMRLQETLRGGPVVTGESTPIYLYHPLVPDRVRAMLPDVRLLAVLRDPVDRAWSHYHHEVRFGNEDLSFREAIRREDERLDGTLERVTSGDVDGKVFPFRHFSYKARGRYAEQVERWLERFDRDQLHVVAAEDLFQRPQEVLDGAFGFLGVGARDVRVRKAHNVGRYQEGMDPDLRAELEAYFAPWNERLEELLDQRFPWSHRD